MRPGGAGLQGQGKHDEMGAGAGQHKGNTTNDRSRSRATPKTVGSGQGKPTHRTGGHWAGEGNTYT